MSLNIPSTISSIYTKLANDVKNLINKSNPFKKNSLTKAVLSAFAGRIWDVYKQIEYLLDQCFDATSDEDSLIREASDYGLTLLPATAASGTISVEGTAGTTIDDDTDLTFNGLIYTSEGDTDITSKTKIVTLTYDDTDCAVAFTEDHNLGNGQSVVISGATPSGIDGTYVVEVDSASGFNITIENVGSSTSSASATYVNAVVNVTSDSFGETYNRNSGEILTLNESIVGADNDAVVTYDGITGGQDIETTEELRARLQQKKKNPASFFNEAQVETTLRELNFVDRVFIQRVTPSVGQATIYLVKANNEIPSATEIALAKSFFTPYLPINTDYSVIFILAPTAKETDFTFSAIAPDTTTMRTAIEANIEAYFEDIAEVGETITEDVYKGIIINTIDPQSLKRLTSFTLTTPSGDIVPSSSELPTLGTVSFT